VHTAPKTACAHAKIHQLLTKEYLSRNLGNVKVGPAISPILLDGGAVCHHPEVKDQAFCADEPVLVVHCDHVPWLPGWLGQLESDWSLHTCRNMLTCPEIVQQAVHVQWSQTNNRLSSLGKRIL